MTTADEGLVTGRSPGRQELQQGQVSRVVMHDTANGEGRTVHVSDWLLDSPAWAPGGTTLVVSGGGDLYRLSVGGGQPERIETDGLAYVDNDHVLTSDGTSVVFSATGHLYRVPIRGETAVRTSSQQRPEREYSHTLHDISPDGTMLAYVAVEPWGGDGHGLYDNSEEAAARPRAALPAGARRRRAGRVGARAAHLRRARQLLPPPRPGRRARCLHQVRARHDQPRDRRLGAAAHLQRRRRRTVDGGHMLRRAGHAQRERLVPDGSALAYVDYPAGAYAAARGGGV